MKNPIANPGTPVCIHVLGQSLADTLHFQGHRAYNAVGVIATTPAIDEWLEQNEPKALEQCLDVMKEDQPNCK